jgi:hypothetical protein
MCHVTAPHSYNKEEWSSHLAIKGNGRVSLLSLRINPLLPQRVHTCSVRRHGAGGTEQVRAVVRRASEGRSCRPQRAALAPQQLRRDP